VNILVGPGRMLRYEFPPAEEVEELKEKIHLRIVDLLSSTGNPARNWKPASATTSLSYNERLLYQSGIGEDVCWTTEGKKFIEWE
jgi:hypothetical protein